MLVGGFYCYKLDFVPFVCTAFDMLEIGAEIEYEENAFSYVIAFASVLVRNHYSIFCGIKYQKCYTQ